jgi:hypothetical protein
MEKRPESRVSAEIPVRVWGMDADGKPFFQTVTGSNFSSEGVQITRVHHLLKVGDIIGIQYADKKARFEIMWVKEHSVQQHHQFGARVLQGQQVPWGDLTAANRPITPPRREGEKRRYTRHKVLFPIDISFHDVHRAHMQCNATDIGGRGCYVESLVPLSIDSEVIVTFWIDSEKIRTNGIVRASDPGVGMGIEFTALETHIQRRLQEYLEKIDQGFAKAATQNK